MRDEARACGVDPYNADCRAAVEAHGALDIMRAAATGSIVYQLSGALLIHEAFEHSECTVCSRAIGTSTPVAHFGQMLTVIFQSGQTLRSNYGGQILRPE